MGNPGPLKFWIFEGQKSCQYCYSPENYYFYRQNGNAIIPIAGLLSNFGCCHRDSNKILSCPWTICNLKKLISFKLFVEQLLLLAVHTLKKSRLSLCNMKTVLQLFWTTQIFPNHTHWIKFIVLSLAVNMLPLITRLWESGVLKKKFQISLFKIGRHHFSSAVTKKKDRQSSSGQQLHCLFCQNQSPFSCSANSQSCFFPSFQSFHCSALLMWLSSLHALCLLLYFSNIINAASFRNWSCLWYKDSVWLLFNIHLGWPTLNQTGFYHIKYLCCLLVWLYRYKHPTCCSQGSKKKNSNNFPSVLHYIWAGGQFSPLLYFCNAQVKLISSESAGMALLPPCLSLFSVAQ